MSSSRQLSEPSKASVLSVLVIGPNGARREEVVRAFSAWDGREAEGPDRSAADREIREMSTYPPDLDRLPQMFEQGAAVVLVELDTDLEYALDLVEGLCACSPGTVMVYSAQAERNLVIRAMRAGAREFLTLPLAPGDLPGAMARVALRGPAPQSVKWAGRKLFVFVGVKGGCGVTTLASSFAESLARDSRQSTLLIDLGLPLGDAAIHLGMINDYSTDNALEDVNRLDASLLCSLLARHSSGLHVLGAPAGFPQRPASIEAIDKLLTVARQNFHYVVVDAGSRLDLRESALFEDSAHVYMVTQVGISELRNANRLIGRFYCGRCQKLDVVLNRYTPHALGFDEEHITRALTRPAQWKVPNEDPPERRNAHPAPMISSRESLVGKAVRQMARSACGLPAIREKKSVFGLFG